MKIRTAVTLSCSSATGGITHDNAEMPILRNFNVAPRYGPAPRITTVLWQPPSYGWIKVNSDGSVNGLMSACGAIFRDSSGAYLASFSCKLQSTSALHTELMAIILAIDKAFERGWSKLWVESDSKVAIQVTKDHSMVHWDLRNRWSKCFCKNMQLLFSHTSERVTVVRISRFRFVDGS
jgi:ribonuclease HI